LDDCERRYSELELAENVTEQSSDVVPEIEPEESFESEIEPANESASGLQNQIVKIKPDSLTEPEGAADNLMRISGIGPLMQKRLNDLGIFHYGQIAAFTKENSEWLNDHLDVAGGIKTENWVALARGLAADKD